MTQHLHRLLIVVPAARCVALNAWVKVHVNPGGGDWFTPNLSATGGAPATHAWACFAATDGRLSLWLDRLTGQVPSIAKPADFDAFMRAQKKAWLHARRDAIQAAIGVRVHGWDNDGTWESPEDALTAMGLKRIA